jgi:hypothetical protein
MFRILCTTGLAGILLVAGAAATPTASHAQAPSSHHRPIPKAAPKATPTVAPVAPVVQGSGVYPVHTQITATVFWIGEPVGNGSTEDNSVSAYDDSWLVDYGGFDDYRYFRTSPFFPSFTPLENPFYLDLPFDDVNTKTARAMRLSVVPWAWQYTAQLAGKQPFSLMKNRWVKLWRTDSLGTHICFGQIEDAGPYVYNDAAYVFGSGDPRPKSTRAANAGLDVSPALRDCLHFTTLNDQDNKVSWQFVDDASVPGGPWTRVVTTRQVNQP